jgi:hypothetical protein
MSGAIEQIFVSPENLLRAVSVVNIEIDNRDAMATLLKRQKPIARWLSA